MFERKLDERIIRKLQKENLFNVNLQRDIVGGEVFPAIRKDCIDFYYRGGRLFSFGKGGFTTHVKYASVYDYGRSYVTETSLKEMVPVKDFSGSYDRIKENCGNYTSVEPFGVSRLYRFSPFVRHPGRYVLLDVEVSLKQDPRLDDEPGYDEDNIRRKMDRIDILLYDLKDCVLHFIEAKDFSNSEIWSKDKPKVIEQVQKYDKQLVQREDEILKAYSDYVSLMKDLFPVELEKPKNLIRETGLYIFGYDGYQQKIVLELRDKIKKFGVPVCIIGNPKGIKIEKLWKDTCS